MLKKLILAAAVAALPLTPAYADKGDHNHDHGKAGATTQNVELPANVKAAFEKDHPGATIKEVEKETYKNGDVHWEIEFTDKDGKTHEVEYDNAGKKLGKH